MKKLLTKLRVVIEVDNDKRKKLGLNRLGQGYSMAYKLNVYNPISYLIIATSMFLGVFIFGFYGAFKNYRNPFKWD